MTALVVEGLDAGYGSTRIVRGLDLLVEPGRIVAVLGPNGAGKSTSLLAMSGLARRFAGHVSVGGRAIDGRSPHRAVAAGLAHVPEDRSLFPGLTVREHIRLAQRPGPLGWPELVDLFPKLGDLTGRAAGLLSGGEQQMLAIARGLAANPTVLLVDELSLGLAPSITATITAGLRRLADDTGMGVVLVEQHLAVALGVADDALVLVNGAVALRGPAPELAADATAVERAYLGAADRTASEP